jgi:hypothetical protein
MDMKAATLLVREKGFDLRPLSIRRQRRSQVRHVGDQLHRLGVGRLPDGQNTDRPVRLCRHPGWPHRQQLSPCGHQIVDVHLPPIDRDGDARCRSTHILPGQPLQHRLQRRPIKLAIPQDDDLRCRGDAVLDLGDQGTMGRLREVPLLPRHDDPRQRQRAAIVDHAHHQGDTAPPAPSSKHCSRAKPIPPPWRNSPAVGCGRSGRCWSRPASVTSRPITPS